MAAGDDLARVEVTSAAHLRDWLLAHHTQDDSVWLVTWKRHTGARHVSTARILDEILCFGWIDGVRRRLDADRTMQLIAPRRTQIWAQSYQLRAARLIAEGRMHPAGLAAIAQAQQLGLWDALAHVDALKVPDDLAQALAAETGAAETGAAARWAEAAPSYRRNVLRWLAQARTSQTRQRRLAAIAQACARGVKLPQM